MNSDELQPVIGLEVHCQLQTETRLFSAGPTDTDAPPNSRVTPYDLGMPGTLPVVDERAIDLALRAGLALECTIHSHSRFDRKHYFYPDLSKGYQITQYARPICTDGVLTFDTEGKTKRLPIQRLHLEEDAGKSIHADGERLLDYNRAGVPLIEIVTAPELASPDEAEAALRALHRLVVHLGISDGNLEEGSFRCDANVSLRTSRDESGPKTELKNLNSFRFVRRALTAEIDRQRQLRSRGRTDRIDQTRRYDPKADRTEPMRTKEASPDYRYVPDPDLPRLTVEASRIQKVRAELPELPRARRRRFTRDMGLSTDDAETLVDPPARADFFESSIEGADHPDEIADFIIHELLARLDGETVADLAITPDECAGIVELTAEGTISSSAASTLLDELLDCDESPETIVDRLDLRQIGDTETLEQIVDDVLDENPELVQRYRGGDDNLFGHFMGQIMQASRGKADPQKASSILREKLE